MHIKNFDPYDFSKKVVNGVPVYYKNLPWAPCIHIAIVFGAGAFNDPKGKEGVAHFLEHLIGNGSPMLPNKKAIKEFSRLYMLNSRNAYTNHYQTVYTGRCLPENFKKVMIAVRDYVFNPFLRVEDVEHERKVITQEAWGRYKNDKYLKYTKEFANNMFSGNERDRITSPLGWPETILNINQKDISDFHKKNYNKENLSIFLVGAIDENDIFTVSEFIKDIPSGNKTKTHFGLLNKPKILRFEKNSDDIGDPSEQLEFSIFRVSEKTNSVENKKKNQAGAILRDILFERLRLENSLCYGVSVYSYRYPDFIESGVSIKAKEENLAIIEKEVMNVVTEILDDKWISRFNEIHKVSIDQIKSGERLSEDIIENSTYSLNVNGEVETLKNIIEDTEKVTYEDVKEIIKDLFNSEWMITEVIFPSKK